MFVINLIFYNRYQKIRPFNFLCNQSRISICWQKSTFFFSILTKKENRRETIVYKSQKDVTLTWCVSILFFNPFGTHNETQQMGAAFFVTSVKAPVDFSSFVGNVDILWEENGAVEVCFRVETLFRSEISFYSI